MKLNKMAFGFSAVQSGQKSSALNAEPRLIANSTSGKFVITSPVTKALDIAVGENVMFINNLDKIENYIATKNEDLVAWCEENGVDMNTVEGKEKIYSEFSVWAITKGVPQFNKNGKPLMCSLRWTKEDKEEHIKNHAAELVAANREELIARVGNEDATDEELAAAITVDDIATPETQSISGSRTATTSNSTGVGCQLNFTDTAIWNALKADLEEKTKKNRVFKVLLDTPINMEYDNGFEKVDIVAFPVEFMADEEPITRVGGEK